MDNYIATDYTNPRKVFILKFVAYLCVSLFSLFFIKIKTGIHYVDDFIKISYNIPVFSFWIISLLATNQALKTMDIRNLQTV